MTRRVWAACWTAAPRPRSPRSCGSASAPSPSVTAGRGRGRGPAGGPPPSPATACPCPAPGRAPPAHTATPGTLHTGLRSGGHSVHCSLGSRGQGGPGAQEAAWLCGDETGNELIRSCGALSKVPPHCHVSRVTCHEPCAGAGPPAELQLRRHRVGAQLAAAAAPRPLRQLARVRRLRLQLGRPGRRAPRQARR